MINWNIVIEINDRIGLIMKIAFMDVTHVVTQPIPLGSVTAPPLIPAWTLSSRATARGPFWWDGWWLGSQWASHHHLSHLLLKQTFLSQVISCTVGSVRITNRLYLVSSMVNQFNLGASIVNAGWQQLTCSNTTNREKSLFRAQSSMTAKNRQSPLQ